MRIARKFVPPLALLAISIITTAYAATTLFSQTFPAISAVDPFTSLCTALNAYSNGSPLSSVTTGSSGSVIFSCVQPTGGGEASVGAFDVYGPGATVKATPTFTLPSPYTALDVIGNNGGCSSGTTFGLQLASGTPFAFNHTDEVNPSGTSPVIYCALYTNAPSSGLPSFTVSWTTPTTPFTQTAASVSATSPSFTSHCVNLTAWPLSYYDVSPQPPALSAVGTGSSGGVYLDCSSNSASPGTTGAFTVSAVSGTGVTVSATPSFTLPAPFTGLFVTNTIGTNEFGLTGGPICSTTDPNDIMTPLMSGTAVSFGSGGTSWGYCAIYQNAPSTGLPAFTVAWTG